MEAEATVELSIAGPFIPYRCIWAQIWDSAALREYGARHASDEVTDALVALIMTLAATALRASAARPASGPTSRPPTCPRSRPSAFGCPKTAVLDD